MAHVNLKTGKIYGANSQECYYHELGHLIFEDSKYGSITRATQDLSLKGIIFTTALGVIFPNIIIKILIVLLILINAISEIFEEKWCWAYSKSKLRGKRDDAWIKKR